MNSSQRTHATHNERSRGKGGELSVGEGEAGDRGVVRRCRGACTHNKEDVYNGIRKQNKKQKKKNDMPQSKMVAILLQLYKSRLLRSEVSLLQSSPSWHQ